MGKTLYIGNVPYDATEEDIKKLFVKYGDVISVKMIREPGTGRSKGFGFVEMASGEAALKAKTTLNTTAFMNRTLNVADARSGEKRSDRQSGRDSGRGRGPGRR